MESGYEQEPVGGGRVRFTVTPASAPRANGPAMLVAVLFGLIAFGLPIGPTGAVPMGLRLVIAALGSWWIHRRVERWSVGRVERSRAPGGTFVVSPSGIEAKGSIIPGERLRLIVANAVRGAVEPTVVDAGSVRRIAAPSKRPASRAAAVSYVLCAEEAGRLTTLAGGMTAATAHGLLADVSRILRLT